MHKFFPLSGYLSICAILCFTACFSQRNTPFDKQKELKVLLISDLNGRYGSLEYSSEVDQVMQEIDKIQPDLVLCAGDMVAGQKRSLSRNRLDSMWGSFYDHVLRRTSLKGIPFGFTMGNHDASPSFHKDRQAAEAFWKAHIKETQLDFVDARHYPFWFSYQQGDCFFISWDASSSKVPREVMQWMQSQLNLPEAKQARMRIVLGHLPLYALVEAKNSPGEVNADADASLAFFKANGVDLYISGHQHAYFPGKKQGIWLLNAGCLGGGPRPLMDDVRGALKTYSVLQLGGSAGLQVQTLNPENNQLIPLKSIPEKVHGFNGTLWRMDLSEN